jgi:hypothetical protein
MIISLMYRFIFKFKSNLNPILFPTKVNFENEGDIYSACSNLTCVVLVIVLVLTHKLTLTFQISSSLVNNYIQENHQDNISGIRTHAINIIRILRFVLVGEIILIRYQYDINSVIISCQ